MKNVFIIGSKGIPSRYGGFETFVDKLTEYKKTANIKYHVACLSDNFDEFEYNGARCFNVKIPEIGPAKAVYYDIRSLDLVYKYIKNNNISNATLYILACRIGPFMNYYKKKFEKLRVPVYVNPDGHEWKRGKWSAPVRQYWKISERLMVKHADLLICDSKNIEKYIKEDYIKYSPNTAFIAYGAETSVSALAKDDPKVVNWYAEKIIKPKEYYLVVGRFVPENNYETMIREFMKSNTKKDFVLITGVEGNAFYEKLKAATNFDQDSRIKFVGTVYDQELLKKIRENAYGYLHGHEVGGTNPSLLEALGSTDLNLLLDVGFNREVGEGGALYWNKQEGNMARVIERADEMTVEEIASCSVLAKKRIADDYSWDYIVKRYEELLLED
ncbi:beta 1-4 rhamnosyltransferase Cps2T [Rossellomorea vietnamensis]|uniref:beta 1-4 rhamnosyltransferase Cps2T n=1 Tax=Rossellomorea vietnamensis TaxID=218284 RepID=UPI003D2C17C2